MTDQHRTWSRRSITISVEEPLYYILQSFATSQKVTVEEATAELLASFVRNSMREVLIEGALDTIQDIINKAMPQQPHNN